MRRSDLTTEKRENVLMGPSEVSSVFPNEPFQLGVLGALADSNFGLGWDHLGLTWQYLVDRGYPEEL